MNKYMPAQKRPNIYKNVLHVYTNVAIIKNYIT